MKRRPTFFWQGLLIVLPVLALAAAGVFSLWRDREAVTLDARRAAAQYGERFAAPLAEELTVASNDLSALMEGAVWAEGSGAILSDIELTGNARPWPNGAIVDSEGTLLRIGAHGAPGNFPRTPSSPPFPFDFLDPGQAHVWAEARTAERRGAERGVGAYRQFLATEPPEPFWFEWEGRLFLVGVAPAEENDAAAGQGAELFEVFCYDEEVLRRRVSRVLSQAALQPPSFVEPVVILHDRRLSGAEPRGEVLATVGTAWPAGVAAADGIEVMLHLSEPELLYARQRQRAFWFGALILMAAGAALVGFASARRAFFRERRLSEMKSDFVASVSHELRAPLASVRLMAEGLERGTVRQPEKQHSYYRFIVQECGRLSALMENVLDFSRIERDRKEYVFEPVDVVALVRQTVELMRPAACERKVRLDIRIDPGTAPENLQPEIDGKAIRQALVNLIDNAVKHSPPGAAVVVGVSAGNSDIGGGCPIRIFVEDRGEGIPAGERERIFERFYRLGSELRRETQGAGIGLSIVKHIVEAHGGTIRVESEPGKGSCFAIQIDGTHTHR